MVIHSKGSDQDIGVGLNSDIKKQDHLPKHMSKKLL